MTRQLTQREKSIARKLRLVCEFAGRGDFVRCGYLLREVMTDAKPIARSDAAMYARIRALMDAAESAAYALMLEEDT